MEVLGFLIGFEKLLGGIVVVVDDIWVVLKGWEVLEIEWDKGINVGYDFVVYLDEL